MKENNLNMEGFEGNSPLLLINKGERLFCLPDGYFEGFAQSVLDKLRAADGETLLKFTDFSSKIQEDTVFAYNIDGQILADTSNAFQVPQGYFENFASNVLRRIKSEGENSGILLNEDESLMNSLPILSGASKTMPFQVPENYFDNLTKHALDVVVKTPAKRIVLYPKSFKVAVAAAVAAIIVSGGLFLNNNENQKPHTKYQYASKINPNAALQEDLSNISDIEIINYLQTPDPTTHENVDDRVDPSTQQQIGSMTNDELENYLDKTPGTTTSY